MAGESFVHRPETSLSDGVVGRQIGVIERYVLHVRRGRGGDVVVPQRNHRKILGQHFLRLGEVLGSLLYVGLGKCSVQELVEFRALVITIVRTMTVSGAGGI